MEPFSILYHIVYSNHQNIIFSSNVYDALPTNDDRDDVWLLEKRDVVVLEDKVEKMFLHPEEFSYFWGSISVYIFDEVRSDHVHMDDVLPVKPNDFLEGEKVV